MCGRYGLTLSAEDLAEVFGAAPPPEHRPRFNIAPTQPVPVLLQEGTERRIAHFRWGLIPAGASDPSVGNRLINARSETVAARPAFRGAWRAGRRCLVLADGFFEWRKPEGGRGPKTPYWFTIGEGRPFGFAGLWERWEGDGPAVWSCTILTTDSNAVVRPIHDRMPVVLSEAGDWSRWIDPKLRGPDVQDLLLPEPGVGMRAIEVSTYVNAPAHEGPECIRPAGEGR